MSVDGVGVAGKQLEDMLSNKEPRKMTIEVDRCAKKSPFSFTLERAADIMHRNQKQAVGGAVMR